MTPASHRDRDSFEDGTAPARSSQQVSSSTYDHDGSTAGGWESIDSNDWRWPEPESAQSNGSGYSSSSADAARSWVNDPIPLPGGTSSPVESTYSYPSTSTSGVGDDLAAWPTYSSGSSLSSASGGDWDSPSGEATDSDLPPGSVMPLGPPPDPIPAVPPEPGFDSGSALTDTGESAPYRSVKYDRLAAGAAAYDPPVRDSSSSAYDWPTYQPGDSSDPVDDTAAAGNHTATYPAYDSTTFDAPSYDPPSYPSGTSEAYGTASTYESPSYANGAYDPGDWGSSYSPTSYDSGTYAAQADATTAPPESTGYDWRADPSFGSTATGSAPLQVPVAPPAGPAQPPAGMPPAGPPPMPAPPMPAPGAAAPMPPPAPMAPPPGAPGGPPPYAQQPPPLQPRPAPPRPSRRSRGRHAALPPSKRPETSRDLTLDQLIAPKKAGPRSGWRRAVYNASGGVLDLGESNVEQYRADLIARMKAPSPSCHRVAVISLKGGVGKTTVSMSIGATLASHRGDRIIAVDANPDRGTLSDKVPLQTDATVRDLLNVVEPLLRYSDVRRFTSQSPDRLEILASERDPAVSDEFSDTDYRRVAAVLERFYNIVITDCGTGLVHSTMAGVLDLADQLVVVSSAAYDGAKSASATLDWLEAHGHADLVRNSVAVVNSSRPGAGGMALARLEQHFASRCRVVTRIPFDPILETGADIVLDRLATPTKDALLELAAAVTDGIRSEEPRRPVS